MANYLNFDIYDLELTEVRCNSELRKILIATANRSILVVEDIDCSIELQDRMAEESASQRHGYPPKKQVRLQFYCKSLGYERVKLIIIKIGINLFIRLIRHIGKIEFMTPVSFGSHAQNIMIRNWKHLGGFLGSFKGYGWTIIPATFRQKMSRIVQIVT